MTKTGNEADHRFISLFSTCANIYSISIMEMGKHKWKEAEYEHCSDKNWWYRSTFQICPHFLIIQQIQVNVKQASAYCSCDLNHQRIVIRP